MNCPSCGATSEYYYFGCAGHNCAVPTCVHFKNGSVNGTKVQSISPVNKPEYCGEDYDDNFSKECLSRRSNGYKTFY